MQIVKKVIKVIKVVICCILCIWLLFITESIIPKEQLSQVSEKYLVFDRAQKQEYDRIKCIVSEADSNEVCSIEIKYVLEYYDMVFSMLVNEDPDMFWLSGLQYRINDNATVDIQITTSLTKEERANIEMFAKNEINVLLKETKNLRDVSAFVHYFQYIYENVEYVSDDTLATSAFGCLYEKQGNCQGYAKLLRYLCIEKGIPCLLVAGTHNDTSHMWNLVYLEGVPYYVDITAYKTYGKVVFEKLPTAYQITV